MVDRQSGWIRLDSSLGYVTAHMFILEANGGNTKNVAIYNNTLIEVSPSNGNNGDGLSPPFRRRLRIYNNTVIGTSGDRCVGTSSSPNVTFINNVVSGCSTLMYVTSGGKTLPV